MESMQRLLSTIPGAVVSALVVFFIVCCCCCCLYYFCKSSGHHSTNKISPKFMESGDGGFEPAQPHSKENATVYNCRQEVSNLDTDNYGLILGQASSPSTDFQHQDMPLVSLDLPDNCHNFSINTISPSYFHSTIRAYIADVVIPMFMGQRNRYQFAVVILLSKKDCQNISKVRFIPSDHQGKPLIDISQPTMPPCGKYHNYIVARPTLDGSSSRHSEVEIFGNSNYSNSGRFDQLWNAYVTYHLSAPDYVLIYSWNLPCSNCTDTIIMSLRNAKYKSATVFLAHTIKWGGELSSQHDLNQEKLVREGIIVQEVEYAPRIKKLYV